MPIRVGVQIQPQQADFAQMQAAWREAEALGADSVDHLSGGRVILGMAPAGSSATTTSTDTSSGPPHSGSGRSDAISP
jgi:hypothetical protein